MSEKKLKKRIGAEIRIPKENELVDIETRIIKIKYNNQKR